MEVGITSAGAGINWAEHWRAMVSQRAGSRGNRPTDYWDRRAPSYARITRDRTDSFLRVLEPYLSPRKTLIDVGAGAGRHAVPLAARLEWVTAVEPSQGLHAQIPHPHNITVDASTRQDADAAQAALAICCPGLY